MNNEYELRKKFLEVEAFNIKKQVMGSLRINMYIIWTGPYHLDFKLPIKDCKTCRVSFNFKMSQGITVKIQNTSTEMLPNQPKTEGQRFTYTLSAIVFVCLCRLDKKLNLQATYTLLSSVRRNRLPKAIPNLFKLNTWVKTRRSDGKTQNYPHSSKT